eukprot:jgi/Ulvmu1/7268/UM035_0056.1
MRRQSPPRKYRRSDLERLGDDHVCRRSRSQADASGFPPPPDVAGFQGSTPGYRYSRYNPSSYDVDELSDEPEYLEEGRGRLERAKAPGLHPRRSPDRFDRRDECRDSYEDETWDCRARDEPTDTIILKGLPDDFRERDVDDLVHGIRGIKDVRMIPRRRGRDGGPMAFVEFHTIEQCVTAEERWLRDRLELERLFRVTCEYAQPLEANRASDWVCSVCKTLNFPRRHECIKCRSDRDWRGDSPSRTVCISNVDADLTEDDLKILVAEHGIAQDVRLVRSRAGSQYGIAYITFATMDDAKATKRAISGARPQGQQQPLEIAFAPDRGAHRASLASQAVAAAAAMNSYDSRQRKDANVVTTSDQGGWKPREVPREDSSGAQATAAPSAGADSASPGFVYDAASGYYYDAGSGYFYDTTTQLYYHSTTQAWYRHNTETGGYDVIPADNVAAASERSEATASEPANLSEPTLVAPTVSGKSQSITAAPTRSSDMRASSATGGSNSGSAPAGKVSKSSAGQGDMVSAWLQRKAEEQRKAARDFLRKSSEHKSISTNDASVVGQTTVASAASAAEIQPAHAVVSTATEADTIVQQLAGGVVRGKVYSKKAF